jgi:3',5'-cyclic AMP phosphodiesterase CpdA
MMVSSRSQIKTRSKFDSGSGDGFGALRFLFRALLDPPGKREKPNVLDAHHIHFPVNCVFFCSHANIFRLQQGR